MFQKLYTNILDAERLKVFFLLKEFKHYGFLAGGTALALQISHRYSYDFDIFCKKKISPNLIQKCRKTLTIGQVLINSTEEFTFLTKSKIKITYLYYPFNFLDKNILTEKSLPLLNIKNIAASKAYTLNRRGSFRDYVDLYFITRFHNISLTEIIKRAQQVFGTFFSTKLFLGQLLYTRDIDKTEIKSIKYIERSVEPKNIYNFFKKEVRESLEKTKKEPPF